MEDFGFAFSKYTLGISLMQQMGNKKTLKYLILTWKQLTHYIGKNQIDTSKKNMTPKKWYMKWFSSLNKSK